MFDGYPPLASWRLWKYFDNTHKTCFENNKFKNTQAIW